MLGVSLIIIAAAIVYMVETYISTYYTIEYMHGTSLFLILLAKYGTPVLFLLLCAYIAYRNFLKKQKAAASAASERPTSKEELYTNKIQTAVKTKSVFSEQADQMLYQVRRFGQKMAVAYSMTQDSKTSGEQAKCLTLLESAERIFYDRLDDAIRSASMFDETEYKAFCQGSISFGNKEEAQKKKEIYNGIVSTVDKVVHDNERLILRLDSLGFPRRYPKIDNERGAKNSKRVNESMSELTTAFYGEYVRRMLVCIDEMTTEMRENANGKEYFPDIFHASSSVIADIFEACGIDLPDYVRILYYNDYMGDESIGRAAIEKIKLAWQADPSKFRVDKKQNRLIYSYPPDGPWYELKYIADELPNSLEAEISGGNQLIMNYEQAQELFGIKFRRWLGIFNL